MSSLLEALPPEPDADVPVARLAGQLLLALDAEPFDTEDLSRAFDAVPRADHRSWTIWQIASRRLQRGRARQAEAVARFGLETHAPAPEVAPALWHVRAEAAHAEGRWDHVDACLDGMEASIPPDSAFARPGSEPALARNHEQRARLLMARAQVLLELGLLDLVRAPARAALEEARASGAPAALAAAYILGFDAAFARGGAAAEAADLARQAAADDGVEAWRPVFRLCEGAAELEEARAARGAERDAPAERARAALESALEAGLEPTEQQKAELALGDLALLLGRFDEARKHIARAVAQASGTSAGPMDAELQLAMLAWRMAHEGGYAESELASARDALFAAFERFLVRWESTPRRPDGVGFLHIAWRAQLVSEVIEAELSREPGAAGVERAFGRLLSAQSMGTRAREHGLGVPSIAEIRAELLGSDRGLVSFLPARDDAWIFLLDARGIECRSLPVGRRELRERAGEITGALEDSRGRVDRDALRALHDSLVPKDLRPRILAWKGCFTSGFDVLRDLPFGILGGEDGRPYAARLALASLPSVPTGLDLARRPRTRAAGGKALVLVVADDPPAGLDRPPFPFGTAERERWVKPFAPGATEVLRGEPVSRDGLLARRELFAGAALTHFLTHGGTDPGRENAAALVLSGTAPESQRLFTSADVARLRFTGAVILSACGSGRGPARTGDDRQVHLGGAFLDAGASCVLLARFPVDYETTLALMEQVHARVAAGDPLSEALRAARAATESADPLAAFHAAAFEVLGLGFER